MPSATATLQLNVSAIQLLCKGTSILNGVGAPLSSIGIQGDLYLDQTTIYPPLIYNLYGPKPTTTGVWPVTAFTIPSTTLVASISSTLSTEISSLSASFTTLSNSMSSITISNNNLGTPLTVQQQSVTSIYPLAVYQTGASTTLIITNSGSLGINTSTPDSDVALHVVGNTRISGALSANTGITTFNDNTFYAGITSYGDNSQAGRFYIYSNASSPSSVQYHVIGTNIDPVTAPITSLSSYTAFFLPLSSVNPGPFRIQNTYFSVGSASTTDNFFYVNPSNRLTTISGKLSSLSAYSSFYYDSNGSQLLTSRQVGPGLQVTTSTTTALATAFNALYSALTAHGLIS